MKLLQASFENFRLLKDLNIKFSTESEKNITVIRAANESGKTTMLNALQWGLFGDSILPARGKNYRLHPLDASTESGTIVNISVTIDYEVEGRTGLRQYRIIRSAVETVNRHQWERTNSSVRLFQLTRQGANPLDNPEAYIRPHLPVELREVFFTDGDRALSFIEGSLGEQMKRVEASIRSLLGLSVVEYAITHVNQVANKLNKKVKSENSYQEELRKVSAKISDIQDQLPAKKEELQNTKKDYVKLDNFERDADKSLTNALRKGNREELARELERTKREWSRSEKDVKQAAKDHSNLFKSQLLAKQLLSSIFIKASDILNELYEKKQIPNQTIPVLEDALSRSTCFCGESLDIDNHNGRKRRDHISQLIEDSRNADSIQEQITDLFYSSKDLVTPVKNRGWIEEYSQVFERRQRANTRLEQLGELERDIEARIKSLPDVDIQQLRQTRDHYRDKKDSIYRKELKLESVVKKFEEELSYLENKQQALLKADEKGGKILSELIVAKDLQNIFESALDTMRTRELRKVSEYTNKLFLDMIGSDIKERSIIQRVEVTHDFRIIVYGQHDRQLDPSQDLNGASRRALTIAFILALTTVSEVQAPNVIDTPLGMMSGHVKQAVLSRATEESTQLILFLTHDEIHGCEEILDKKAGKVYTITNSAHYPRFLVNNPETSDTRVVLCDCNHQQFCNICERKEKSVIR